MKKTIKSFPSDIIHLSPFSHQGMLSIQELYDLLELKRFQKRYFANRLNPFNFYKA